MKSGIKTSEFWVSLLALFLINLSAVFVDSEWTKMAAIIGDALVAAGYVFGRSKVKDSAAWNQEDSKMMEEAKKA